MDFYKFENLPEAKKLYTLYAREEGRGLRVSCCGKNRGSNSKPNVIFHLPDYTVPVSKTGDKYNALFGLCCPELAKSFFQGFSNQVTVVPAEDITQDHHDGSHKHLYVTLDPQRTNYLLVANRRVVDDGRAIPSALMKFALHYCPGAPSERHKADEIYYDYYIFAMDLDYASSVKKGHTVSSTDEEAENQMLLTDRRKMLRKFLLETFGDFTPSLWTPVSGGGTGRDETAMEQATDQPHSPRCQTTEKAEAVFKRAPETKPFKAMHYEDGFSHEQGWVLDKYGRLLAPKIGNDETSSFVGATVARRECWEIAEDCLAIQYCCESPSAKAQFSFFQKPEIVTQAQLDRLEVLQHQLMQERIDFAKACGVKSFTLPAQKSNEPTWYDQLAKPKRTTK